jgi:D-amino peptidase
MQGRRQPKEQAMKILIAADMEGITGVVHWNDVDINHPEYQRFRRIMTGDVNAAVRGAFEGGADEVLITDGHHFGRNIVIEELDPRVRLNSGSPSPLSMVEGVDKGVAGAMFVGYHARIGAQNAVLDHTWSDERVANLWIGGRLVGETGLNAAVCGHFDVPVILLSGDQTVCAEARGLLGDLETAVVKQALGRYAAECLPIAVAQELIQTAAARAASRLRAGQAPAPFRLPPPITVAVDFVHSEMADRAMIFPGATRGPDRRVTYAASDMLSAYSAFRTLQSLGR